MGKNKTYSYRLEYHNVSRFPMTSKVVILEDIKIKDTPASNLEIPYIGLAHAL